MDSSVIYDDNSLCGSALLGNNINSKKEHKIIVCYHEITVRCFADPGTYLQHLKNENEEYNEKIIILR